MFNLLRFILAVLFHTIHSRHMYEHYELEVTAPLLAWCQTKSSNYEKYCFQPLLNVSVHCCALPLEQRMP